MFQKRLDGSVDFDRVWNDYKQGFGSLSGEFWLGLDKVHRLTKKRNKLRVELEDFNGQTAYAEYDLFGVANHLPFYIPFLRERYPFRIPFVDEWYPFHIPCLERCIPYNCCKCTVFLMGLIIIIRFIYIALLILIIHSALQF